MLTNNNWSKYKIESKLREFSVKKPERDRKT